MFASIGIHAILIVLFIFIAAWRQQIPPPEPIGMSINFGTSDQGFGEVQPETREEAEPVEEETPTEQVEEVQDPVEEVVEESTDTPQEEVIETVQDKGPVAVEEKKEATQEEAKEEEVKPKEETKPVEEKVEEVVEEKKEERKLEAVYTGPTSDKTNTETNQGEKEGTTGDQGSEEGQLDSRTQFGGPGKGGLGYVDMAGWNTDFKLPDNKPAGEGVLQFRITINSRGTIDKIIFLKKIGNTDVEKFYRDYILREMRFQPRDAGNIPESSTGTVTLNLKVK